MSRAGNRAKAIADARRKLDHAVNRRELAIRSAESARHRPLGDPQVEDSGRLGPGERSEDWIRERTDAAEEAFQIEAAEAIGEIEAAVAAARTGAEADLRAADEARRGRIDYRAEESRRAEIRSRLSGSEAMIGESKVTRIARLADGFRRRGDEVGLRALRTDPEVHEVVFDPHLSGPTATLASNLRGVIRAAEQEEYAEVHAVEAEIASYDRGEVARALAEDVARVRSIAGSSPTPEPEPEGAEA